MPRLFYYSAITACLVLLNISLRAQIKFEKGYRIDHRGDSTAVWVENLGWTRNPVDFQYKDSVAGPVKIGQLSNTVVWGIPGKVRYEKYIFENFRLPDQVQSLDTTKKVFYFSDTAYLRVLADGAGRLLYLYENGKRRFFAQQPGKVPQVLVRKEYDQLYADFNQGLNYADRISQRMVYRPFRKQLFNTFRCSFVKKDLVNELEYQAKDLIRFFETYNRCMGQGSLTYPKQVPASGRAHYTLKAGLRPVQLQYRHLTYTFRDLDFPDQLLYSLGLEFEYFFTAGNNKFSLLLEPTFFYLETSGETEPGRYQRVTTVRYHPLEIPGQLRYSFFLENQSRLYLNAGFIYSLNLGSSFATDDGREPIEINTGMDVTAGLGFRFRESWSVEYRFLTQRNLMNWNKGQYLHFDNFHSIFLGYTIR